MEIFDAAAAIAQAGGNEELAKELFGMLLKELPEQQQTINNALNQFRGSTQNCQLLWEPVHKLHGATAYLGLPALRDASKKLESCIKENQSQQIEDLTHNLLEQIEAIHETGDQILAQVWS